MSTVHIDANQCARCTLPTVQHTDHAKTWVSKHVGSFINTERSQFSEYIRNQDSSELLSLALNLPLLCRLIAMFLTSSMSSAPRAAPGKPADKKSKSQDVSRRDRQPEIQTSLARGRQSDVLFLSRELSRSGGTAEKGGGGPQEQGPHRDASFIQTTTKKKPSWQLCSTGQRC